MLQKPVWAESETSHPLYIAQRARRKHTSLTMCPPSGSRACRILSKAQFQHPDPQWCSARLSRGNLELYDASAWESLQGTTCNICKDRKARSGHVPNALGITQAWPLNKGTSSRCRFRTLSPTGRANHKGRPKRKSRTLQTTLFAFRHYLVPQKRSWPLTGSKKLVPR